jgi:5'-3' exonuclease
VGVKNWGKIIPWRWTSIDELEPRVIAFDAPNYISRRLSVIPSQKIDRAPTSHVHILLATVLSCLRCHILPVFVFDGPPEQLKRMTNPQLIQTSEDLYQRWLASDEDYLRDRLESFASPAVRLYFALHHTKDICAAAGIPVVAAPSEAEMAAAVLCQEGKVGTVASNDADALLFGAGHVTRSIRLSKGQIERVLLSDFQARLELDLERMKDLAIVCGCDFHKRGVRGVGPRKGAIGLRRHGSLENLLRALGLPQAEIEEYLKARDVFDEPHFLTMRIDSMSLQPPVKGRVARLLEPALGGELAEHRASEFLRLWKGFGRVQMTLEGWIS